MARIPVYGPTASPSGLVQTRVAQTGLDLTPISRGAFALADSIEQERELHQKQRDAADLAEARTQFLGLQDTLADAFEDHSTGILDGTVDKTSAKTKWAEQTKPLIDGAIEKIPPAHRQVMAGQLRHAVSNLERKLDRVVAKKDRTDTAGAIDNHLEYAARLAQVDYEAGKKIALDTLMQLGPFAGLDAATVQRKANAWKEEAAYTRGLGMVTSARASNAALSKAEGMLDGMADLDPRKKVQLIGTIEQYKATNTSKALAAAQHAEILAQRHERKASSAWETVSGYVAAGKMPDAPTMAAIQKAMSGTIYEKSLPGLMQQVPERTAAAMQPLPVQQAQIDALYERRNTQGTNPQLEAEIKRREQVREASRTDYAKDPIGAHIERNLAKPIPLDFNDPATISARAEQAKQVSIFTGKPTGILRPEEATDLARRFEKMAAAEKELLVKTIYQATGPQVGISTFAQLSKEAPTLAVAAGLAGRQTSAGRSVSQLIFQGEELLKTKTVMFPGSSNPDDAGKVSAEWQRYVGNAIPQPAARDAAINATAAVYAKLMHEAGKVAEKNIDREVFQQAARIVTGGGPIKRAGSMVLPLNYGVSATDTRTALSSITPEMVKNWGGVAGMTDEDAAEYLKSAPLESQTFGKYRVPAGMGILQRKDGQPFEMIFR